MHRREYVGWLSASGTALLPLSGCLDVDFDDSESREDSRDESPRADSNSSNEADENDSETEKTEPSIELEILFDEYESLNVFTVSDYVENLSIVPAPDFEEETNSCKVVFPEGTHDAANLRYLFGPEHGFEPEAMHARYWLYFDESFEPSTDGKLPGFAGTYDEAGSGGRQADGTNGWSARGSFYAPEEDDTVPIGNYVYHVDMDSSGTHALWDASLERGRWYQIDQYLELNTPGEYDGVLRGWVDQSLVYDSDYWRWRDTDDLKIQEWWGHFYHGGDDPAPENLCLYIDGLAVTTTSLL